MHAVTLQGRGELAEWRDAARALAMADVAPAQVDWRLAGTESLFDAATPLSPAIRPPPRVPRAFLELAEAVICHADPARFALLYRLLVRLQDDPALLSMAADADVVAAERLAKSVRRDCHKMAAFVRFRETAGDGARRRFLAWFEPDHHIVARKAPFFARRFADMDWMILTPRGSAAFEDGALSVSSAPAAKPALDDPTDALWLTYYASIFNPARVKVAAMMSEMPKKYWKNLPEAALIPELLAQAPARVAAMTAQAALPPPAHHARIQARRRAAEALAAPEPPAGSLAALHEGVRACTRCPLHCGATQAVFGEGAGRAELMIVGEQPGDREDLAGRPFVGPAGAVLDRALSAAGIDRASVWLTNAVKHFKHEPRGKRRLHVTPNAQEVEHCRWWLRQEIALVRPRLVVAMGATAVRAITGESPRLGDVRGRILPLDHGRQLLVTTHPAYLLRLPDARRAAEETARFHTDLAAAGAHLAARSAPVAAGA
jgi:DNA polymerase